MTMTIRKMSRKRRKKRTKVPRKTSAKTAVMLAKKSSRGPRKNLPRILNLMKPHPKPQMSRMPTKVQRLSCTTSLRS